MSTEDLSRVRFLLETASQGALVTGDHVYGVDSMVADSAKQSVRDTIKKTFPDIDDVTLDYTISRGVMIKRGRFMGNRNMTMEGLLGGNPSDDGINHKLSDEILKQIFGDSDQLASFKG